MPQSVSVQLQLAEALAANGNHREAMAAAKRAQEIDPGNIDAAAALGAAYLENKRYREALELAQLVQKKNPRFGYALEGDTLMAQQDYARAAAAYRKADAIEGSGTMRIRAHQAESLSSKGPVSDASLVDWVTRHPEDVNPRLYLADLYAKAGKNKAAIAHYEALLRVDPKDFRVINNLAWALQQDGDPRAIEYAHQAFQLKPGDAT
jgi:tetratricopeptide (TPR) repeat protein